MTSSNNLMQINRGTQQSGNHVSVVILIGIRISNRSRRLFKFTRFASLHRRGLNTLLANLRPSVIRVRIRRPRTTLNLRIRRVPPHTSTQRHNIPTFIQAINSLQGPRITFIRRTRALLFVRCKHVLTLHLSIIATSTSVIMIKGLHRRIIRLTIRRLLATRGIRTIRFSRTTRPQTTALPTITTFNITPVNITSVVNNRNRLLDNNAGNRNNGRHRGRRFLRFGKSFGKLRVRRECGGHAGSPPTTLPRMGFSTKLMRFRT